MGIVSCNITNYSFKKISTNYSQNTDKVETEKLYPSTFLSISLCFNSLRGCIGLRFQWILKDFFVLKKFCGIQSRFLRNVKHSCGIQLGFSRFCNESNKIWWYSIKILHNLKFVCWYSKFYGF